MPKLIHTMIRVQDLDRATRFYTDVFALRESHRLTLPSFVLVYLQEPQSGFEIELTWNQGREEPYTHGSGYGHMAFCVAELKSFHESLRRTGYQPGEIKALTVDGVVLARFFFITDPDGYKIEVLEKGGHYI
jgi:lactoylglutathione lyase